MNTYLRLKCMGRRWVNVTHPYQCLTSWCFVDKETDYSEGLFDTSVNIDITQLAR